MPRYFFNLTFGQRVVPDEEGVELPNQSAARDEALAAVRGVTDPQTGRTSRRWAGWFLEVADDRGGFFRTPIGHPALQVVSSEPHASPAEAPDLMLVREAATVPYAPAASRTAEIVRQMQGRRQLTQQLLKDNRQFRAELLSVCLASGAIRVRTNRLVLLARAASSRD
jgi:hypothetical protein